MEAVIKKQKQEIKPKKSTKPKKQKDNKTNLNKPDHERPSNTKRKKPRYSQSQMAMYQCAQTVARLLAKPMTMTDSKRAKIRAKAARE